MTKSTQYSGFESNINVFEAEDNKILSNPFGTYRTKVKIIDGLFKFDSKKLGEIKIEVPVAENKFIKMENSKGYYEGYKTRLRIVCKKRNFAKTVWFNGILTTKEEVTKAAKTVFDPLTEVKKMLKEDQERKLKEINYLTERYSEDYLDALNHFYEEGII